MSIRIAPNYAPLSTGSLVEKPTLTTLSILLFSKPVECDCKRDRNNQYISMSSLDRAPVISPLLVVQVPDTSNMRRMAVCFRPIDGGFLSGKSAKYVVALGLDHIVINVRAFRAALGPSFNVDGSHIISFPY